MAALAATAAESRDSRPLFHHYDHRFSRPPQHSHQSMTTMKTKRRDTFFCLFAALILSAGGALAQDKPALLRPDDKPADQTKKVKVFILAGQSNMQGHAKVSTFEHIGMDPATKPMLAEMLGADGKPKVCERVWISSIGCAEAVKRVVPDYDAAQGCELAGFAWFQGWNDLVDGSTYPNREKPGGYDAYRVAIAHFIRDVRRDLNAPKLLCDYRTSAATVLVKPRYASRVAMRAAS